MPRCPRCNYIYRLSNDLVACPRCGQRGTRTASTEWDSGHLSSHDTAPHHIPINSTLPTTTPGQFWTYSRPHVTTSIAPAPHEHGTLSKVQIATILFLALLLILSGGMLLYYTLVTHPAQVKIEATATAQQIETAQADVTQTAQRYATETAQAQMTAQARANATALVRTAIEAWATASALQDIYTQGTIGKPDRSSTLAYETGFHWDIYPTRDDGGCTFHGNAYHSIVNTTHSYVPCLASDTHYGNLAIEVQMTLLKGDEGGLIFHASARGKGFYSFRIRRNGTYTLLLTLSDGHTISLISQSSNLIHAGTGKANTLSVITHGSAMYLYINHYYVGSASDATYRSGSIGVIATNHEQKTDVAFTNLRIWKLR